MARKANKGANVGRPARQLTHFDPAGNARMVDVGTKPVSERIAVAAGEISMRPETLRMIKRKTAKKGDVLAVAQLAGIMAAKRTSELIPLCHPLGLDSVSVELSINGKKSCVEIIATCRVAGRTGVEMEALAAVSVAALTVYDMVKAVDREMVISDIRLIKKSGGKSGSFERTL